MHINKSIINIIKTYINNKMIFFKSRSIKTITYSFYIVLLDQISKFVELIKRLNAAPLFFTRVKFNKLGIIFLDLSKPNVINTMNLLN